jgi:hypothetical protein
MSGIHVTYNALPIIRMRFPKVVSDICLETAELLVNFAKQSMLEPKHVAVSESHQASAPGEAPAVDTSMLINTQTAFRNDLGAVAAANTEYALPLEFGTYKMAARPFFRPAVEKVMPFFIGKLSKLEGRL